ncbi:hypothetical protein [Nonomuraea sp. NPDC001023]|uniref:hypothetical protein n=1 Tax=unclassified Nonomuraea TaxID=2593643 RepID=UPI003330886E
MPVARRPSAPDPNDYEINGDQVVEVGEYAYRWHGRPALKVGERVLLPENWVSHRRQSGIRPELTRFFWGLLLRSPAEEEMLTPTTSIRNPVIETSISGLEIPNDGEAIKGRAIGR